MNRQFFYKESLNTVSRSGGGGTPILATDFYFQTDVNAEYFVFFSADILQGSNSNQVEVQFWDNYAGVRPWPYALYDPHDGANFISVCGFSQVTEAAQPISPYWFETYIGGNNGIGIKQIKNMRFLALKKSSADDYAEGSLSTSSTTFQDVVTITIPTSGDYLVLGSAGLGHSSSADNGQIQLTHNSTVYNLMNIRPNSTDDVRPWFAAKKITATASDTVKIQIRSQTANTTTTYWTTLAILRLDGQFDNNYYAQTTGTTTSTSGTYQDQVTLSATTLAEVHLIFYNSTGWISSTAQSVFIRGLDEGSNAVDEMQVEPWVALANDRYNFGSFQVKPLSAGSQTWKTQFYSSGGALATVNDGSIAVLQLTGTPTVKILGKTKILGTTKIL